MAKAKLDQSKFWTAYIPGLDLEHAATIRQINTYWQKNNLLMYYSAIKAYNDSLGIILKPVGRYANEEVCGDKSLPQTSG